jgi:hypothetical protein
MAHQKATRADNETRAIALVVAAPWLFLIAEILWFFG